MPGEPQNGWSSYQRLVLDRLDRIDRKIETLDDRITHLYEREITTIKVELAMLKVKSGLWGAAAGLIPTGLLVVYTLLKGP